MASKMAEVYFGKQSFIPIQLALLGITEPSGIDQFIRLPVLSISHTSILSTVSKSSKKFYENNEARSP